MRKSHTLSRKRQHPTQTFKSTEGRKVLTETRVKMAVNRVGTEHFGGIRRLPTALAVCIENFISISTLDGA